MTIRQNDFQEKLEIINNNPLLINVSSRVNRLYVDIHESDKPFDLIKTLVQYCTFKPAKDKITNGSKILSKMPSLLAEFIDKEDHNYFGEIDADRTWLYRESILEIFKLSTPIKKIFIKVACEWLQNEESCVREDAAKILSGLFAVEAHKDIEKAIEKESCSTIKKTLEDILRSVPFI